MVLSLSCVNTVLRVPDEMNCTGDAQYIGVASIVAYQVRVGWIGRATYSYWQHFFLATSDNSLICCKIGHYSVRFATMLPNNCTFLLPVFPYLNPLGPKSDQHQISPCNTNAL